MLIKRGRNALLVLSIGKALVSPESRLKQKQPASSCEDTRLAIDFHLMIPCINLPDFFDRKTEISQMS